MVPNLHLTDLAIRALKGSGQYVTYWDDTTPGFGIRVGMRAKTWTVMRGRNRERVTIGRYPDLSLADARTEAKRLLSTSPEAKAASKTFKEARTTFLDENYRDGSARTKYQVTRSLERHFKALEPMQLADITDGDVKKALDKISNRPSEQLHAFRYVRAFFNWCTRPPRRYIKHSPMAGYEPPSTDKRGSRVLSDDELKAVWNAASGPRLALIRLMILWGTRNEETTVLARSWLLDDVLTIPGANTKNGRDHAIPVLPKAQEVIDEYLKGNADHLFPGRWGDGHIHHGALGKLKGELMKASGTKGWQLRDLRRTFRSNMARLGVPRDVCEVLINHAPPVLDEIYDRYDRLPEKRDALARYEAFLQTLLAQG
jgi:site-specific recombinase XerD